MRLLNKKNNCLLPLLVKSAVLFAHNGAEFHLQDSDLVSLNNTQLISIEEGGVEYQGDQVSLFLNETSNVDLNFAITSELAFFWNDHHIFDLASTTTEQVWLLSTDCDSFGIPKTLKLQPHHRLIVPSASCLKSQKMKRWQFISIVFKPQPPVASSEEVKTYDLLKQLTGKSKWFPGMPGSDSFATIDGWPGFGIDGSMIREKSTEVAPQYVELFLLNTPIEGAHIGATETLMNQIVENARSIEELYRMLQKLLGGSFRESLKSFRKSIGYDVEGARVETRWVLDYLRHFMSFYDGSTKGKKAAAEAMTDDERTGSGPNLLQDLITLQGQGGVEPSKEHDMDSKVAQSYLNVFWQEASVVTAANTSPANLALMTALAEAVDLGDLSHYVCRMLRARGLYFSERQVRRYILDSFKKVSPLDLFRFIRSIPNFAVQISHDFYHLLGANPRLLSELRRLGVQYRPDELAEFRRQEREARRQNKGKGHR